MGVHPALLAPRPDALLEGVSETLEAPDMSFLLAPALAVDPQFRTWFAQAGMRGASPTVAMSLFQAMATWDVRDVLGQVRAPTLVVHREGNRFIDPQQSTLLASHIPDARLVLLPGSDVVMWSGDTGPLLDVLSSHVAGATTKDVARQLTTVFFSDLVGSTQLASTLGDASWRELLEQHDQALAKVAGQNGGRVVSRTGDGALALFDLPSRALRAAQETHRVLAALGLEARVAIHVGEVERRGSEVAGINVHATARLLSEARGGETVVSAVVPFAVLGAGYTFDRVRTVSLRGFEAAWDVWTLRSRGSD